MDSSTPEGVRHPKERVRKWAWDQPCDAGRGKLVLLAICELMPGPLKGLELTPENRARLVDLTGMPEHKLFPLINGLTNSAVLLRNDEPGTIRHVWPNSMSIPYPEYVLRLKDRPGYVYLLHSNGKYKIGKTRDIKQRIASLSTGSAEGLELLASCHVPDAIAYEQHLHRHFAGKWIRGEWFRLAGPDVKAIVKAMGGPS